MAICRDEAGTGDLVVTTSVLTLTTTTDVQFRRVLQSQLSAMAQPEFWIKLGVATPEQSAQEATAMLNTINWT